MTLYHGNLQVGNLTVMDDVRGEAVDYTLVSDVDGVALYEWQGTSTRDRFTCTIGTDNYMAIIIYM